MMYDFEYGVKEASVLTLVMQTRDVISQLSEKQLCKVALTPEKFHTLLLCLNSKEPVTVAELSRMLFRKPHTVSGLLTRMETEGLVKRDRPDTQENQGPMHVIVTDKGVAVFKQGMQIMMISIDRFMEGVTQEELEQLEKGLRSLRNSILREMNMESRKMTLPLR
jgi:DNA-binding MarR family transcriptional regulator